MIQVRDPAWKRDADLVAEESFARRYGRGGTETARRRARLRARRLPQPPLRAGGR